MKTKISYLLAFCLLPFFGEAQPLIQTNEFYHIGDNIHMVNCNPDGVHAGTTGGGVTWDFSTLVASGGYSTTSVALNTSSAFLTSNLMITLPNGFTEYMKENNTDSYIDGIFDNGHNITYNYYNLDIAKRPFTYNSVTWILIVSL